MVVTDQMWGIPVDRITLDGVEQVREKRRWQSAAPNGRVLRAGHLREPEGSGERLYFKAGEDEAAAAEEQIDKCARFAGRLLREAPAFQRLLADLKLP